MATRTIVKHICDVHGGDEDATHIGVPIITPNGRFKLDCCDQVFDQLMQPLVELEKYAAKEGPGFNGSKVGAKKASASRPRKAAGADESVDQKARAWAQANGVPVSGRGRVSATVREQFEAASA